MYNFVVQPLNHVQLFATPWTAVCQASLSFTTSESLLKLMSIAWSQWCHPNISSPVIPFSSCIQSFPASVFSELALCIRWPKYWSFSIKPSNEYSGLISFRIDWSQWSWNQSVWRDGEKQAYLGEELPTPLHSHSSLFGHSGSHCREHQCKEEGYNIVLWEMCSVNFFIHLCCCCLATQSCPTLLWPPWTVACQYPLSKGFPRKEYWSGLPFPPLGDLPNPGLNLNLLWFLHLQADSLTRKTQSSFIYWIKTPVKSS